MKTLFYKTVVCITIFLCTQCYKNDEPKDQLPPITQIGANTFGCIVNGKVFIPKDSYSTTPGNNFFKGLKLQIGENFEQNNGDDFWEISTGNFKINPTTYIYLYIPKLLKSINNYKIGISDGLENRELNNPQIYCHINGNNNTYLSYENSGNINFSKIDIPNGIYSGTFTVNLKNKDNPNDIIQITNGRFDINLNTVNN